MAGVSPLQRSFLLLFTLFSVIFVSALEDPDVLVLTTENFDKTIEENPLILVEFYAPWCGHCKNLAPEYAKAATELKNIVPLAKVDADAEQNKPLAQRFGIRGFPTLKFFRNGNSIDYQGQRTAEAIVSYLKRQSQPAVMELATTADVNKFKDEEKVAIVGFFDTEDSEEFGRFQSTAEQLRDSFTFGAVVGHSDVNKEFGIETVPNLILFKQFDEKQNVLDTTWDELTSFIKKNSVPILDEIGPQNFKNYLESGLPLVYLFVDLRDNGQKEQYLEIVNDIAKETKGKLNWVYIDWAKYAKHTERLGLSGENVPALAIENLADGTHYPFDETKEINKASVKDWIDKFLSGNLEPTIKSEEIPADNNGPVKIIVAKTFDEIVNDPTKDVLVEFYAPWCGHCKALAPTYEEVGNVLKHVKSLVIAKIDATANDVKPSLNIRGFPTIKLFKADDKQDPIDYEGDRTKTDLISFLENHVSIKFEAPNVKDEL